MVAADPRCTIVNSHIGVCPPSPTMSWPGRAVFDSPNPISYVTSAMPLQYFSKIGLRKRVLIGSNFLLLISGT